MRFVLHTLCYDTIRYAPLPGEPQEAAIRQQDGTKSYRTALHPVLANVHQFEEEGRRGG